MYQKLIWVFLHLPPLVFLPCCLNSLSMPKLWLKNSLEFLILQYQNMITGRNGSTLGLYQIWLKGYFIYLIIFKLKFNYQLLAHDFGCILRWSENQWCAESMLRTIITTMKGVGRKRMSKEAETLEINIHEEQYVCIFFKFICLFYSFFFLNFCI